MIFTKLILFIWFLDLNIDLEKKRDNNSFDIYWFGTSQSTSSNMTNYVVIDQSKSLNMFGPITNDSNSDLLSSSSRSEEDDNFPCGYCQKTFQTFPQMVNHIQNNHYQLDLDTNFSPHEQNKDSADFHNLVGKYFRHIT